MPKMKVNRAAKKRLNLKGGKKKTAFMQRSSKQHRLHQKSKRQKHLMRKGAKLPLSATMRKALSRAMGARLW